MSAALIDAAVEYEAAVAATVLTSAAVTATYAAYQTAVVASSKSYDAERSAKLRLLGVAANPTVLP